MNVFIVLVVHFTVYILQFLLNYIPIHLSVSQLGFFQRQKRREHPEQEANGKVAEER